MQVSEAKMAAEVLVFATSAADAAIATYAAQESSAAKYVARQGALYTCTWGSIPDCSPVLPGPEESPCLLAKIRR